MVDPLAGLREALVDRYAIEREFGRGGMATVYLARDLRHDRPVALKVLHPELAATLGPERFQREIRLAARLQHPHILTVLDSGEASGAGDAGVRLWFTMPFVDGESLRSRLDRERQLPIEDAVRIARQAADALDYAHRHGIIHRDIKPENILLAGEHALVADFGIARALGAGAPEGLTETGITVGTPAYMSPEQASGERELDGRTDIYSLGVVLYEMLAGEPPFAGPTVQAMIARRFTETARPLRSLRETVPEAVEQAVAKALARMPADRFATAGEMARAIDAGRALASAAQVPESTRARPMAAPSEPARRIHPHRISLTLVLAIGFALGLGVLFAWRHTHGGGGGDTTAAGTRLLAVLPFENLGAQEDEYFADGVTDEVRGKLASVPGLQVTARSSSRQYKKTSKTPQEIGRELGVDYLLTGTVRWEKSAGGNRVRVSPELIQVSTASTKWQQPFDAALSDVFQVQADIAGRVAQALNVALEAPKQEQLKERPTQNLAAYDAYLKGEETAEGIWAVDPATLRRAAGYYEQAVALDSSFAQAWAQLSRVLSYAYYVGNPTAADAQRARLAADRVMALAPNRAEGHLALGDYYRYVRRDHRSAQEQYTEGQRVAPNNADLLTGAALAEEGLSHWDSALEKLQKSVLVDPRSTNTARRLAFTQLWLRRYPEAAAAYDRALALSPTNLQALEGKSMVRLAQGDLAGARLALAAALKQVEPTALVAYFSNYWDLFWLLEPEQQALLLRLTPAAFDDNRAAWSIVLTQTYHLRGDRLRSRAYADTARAAFEERLKAVPDDPQAHVILGLALAYMGRKSEAIREGEKAVAMVPIARDGYNGPYYQHQLVRIYVLAGEPEKALDRLEPLLKIPYFLSPGWFRVDPTFDPLRKNPRFQKLVEGAH
jgi:TolB-like protein/Tfp pilus assembly protein PilF